MAEIEVYYAINNKVFAAYTAANNNMKTLDYCSGTNCIGYRGTQTKTRTGKAC